MPIATRRLCFYVLNADLDGATLQTSSPLRVWLRRIKTCRQHHHKYYHISLASFPWSCLKHIGLSAAFQTQVVLVFTSIRGEGLCQKQA